MKALILRAFFFSSLIISPSIIEFFLSDGYSPLLFSDWDEPYYLPLPGEAAQLPWLALLQIKNGSIQLFSLLDSHLPHVVFDFLIGKILAPFTIRPISFGIMADFVCLGLSYLMITLLLTRPDTKSKIIESIAILSILLPWLVSLDSIIKLHVPGYEHLTTYSHNFFPSIPAMRGLYTQFSFVGFLSSIFVLSRLLNRTNSGIRVAFFLGIISGLLVYFYFFAWGAFLFLASLSMAIRAFSLDRTQRGPLLSKLFVCSITNLLIAAPGLSALLGQQGLFVPGPALDTPILPFRDFWFFSPFMACLAIFYMYRLWSCRYRSENTYQNTQLAPINFIFIISAIISELILMNIQPLIQRWITPYHFSLFFLHPLLSILILDDIFSAIKTCSIKRLLPILAGCLVGISLFAKFHHILNISVHEKNISSLAKFLATNTSLKSNVAIIPFEREPDKFAGGPIYRLLPYWIKSLSSRATPSQFMSFSYSRENLIERELMLTWLYTGKIGLMAPCLVKPILNKESDVLTGAQAFHAAQRASDCRVFEDLFTTASTNKLFKSPIPDYLIWETSRNDSADSPAIRFGEKVWSSPDQELIVLKLDQEKIDAIIPNISQYNASPQP